MDFLNILFDLLSIVKVGRVHPIIERGEHWSYNWNKPCNQFINKRVIQHLQPKSPLIFFLKVPKLQISENADVTSRSRIFLKYVLQPPCPTLEFNNKFLKIGW